MVTIYLYEPIEKGAAAEVIEQLRNVGNRELSVRINSPGGDVAEGIAIYNALKPFRPTVFIDGVAASIASFIAMAGGHIIAAENALVMVHNPWTQVCGDSTQIRHAADALDKHRDALLSGYARTGIARTSLLELLASETWMTADDALAMGFVDEIAEPLRFAAHAPEHFAGFINTPKELLMKRNTARKPVKPASNANSNDNDNDDGAGGNPGNDNSGEPKKAADFQALRTRNEGIIFAARSFAHVEGVQDLAMAALSDTDASLEDFQAKVMALAGKDISPLAQVFSLDSAANRDLSNARFSGGNPAGSDFVLAVSDAMLIRAGIAVEKPHAGARDVMGMGLQEVMRNCVARSGGQGNWAGGDSRRSFVRAALSTSDFPAILENSLGKALRTGYEAEPATFEAWTRKVLVPDFKEQSRVILGSAPSLKKVLEGAEYEYGPMDEDKSLPYKVDKFGRMVQLTWETLVNDDLGAFVRIVQAMGQASLRAEADLIYQTFAANAGAGPTMQDGVTLFHADHGNLAASSVALDAGALGAARLLLRRQTALGGGMMNLTPRFLIVAPEHEQTAEILLAAAGRAMSQGESNTLTPAWMAKLELVVEARLTEDAFYLATSPDNVDTLERAWLEQDDGPNIQEADSFAVDAKTYKIRHVFGSRWLDWRGVVKGPISG
ncbi:hypothetical protein GCM10011521_05940 [Arenimonas soli]|uniref:ATP-dependent Clp protease proteolytic subunit n=1 Tax=Arenimonas soli TaxID=2269504 RepID=A0ABQ1HC74_9GAMM|nr:head maturation protease, ClpP-related [Arenimonas soli]GGA70664.1 hypothetical protein GCM10011521_05940 [Arenimonas soli]